MAQRPFVVDPALTAISIGYRNTANMLIADDVLPMQPVGGEKFSWTEYGVEEAFTVPDNEVGRRGRTPELEFGGSERESAVKDYGFESPIPYSDITEAARMRSQGLGTFDPEKHAVMRITDANILRREKRVADLVQDPANYEAGRKVALVGTDKLDDYDNSQPIEVLKEAINGTFIFRANTLVMGHKVWQAISSHPHIVNAIRGNLTDKGIVRREEVAALFEVNKILVGEGYLNVAQKGQPVDLQRVWGNSIQALYINPQARPEGDVTFGMTATYGTRIAGRIEDKDIGLEGGVRIRQGDRVRELIIAKGVGYQITGAVSD
ncbi:unnamed protein product [Effrenium voratum]|uniref:Capsid protein n=1 Tax=Effrenium voratum TaxID=2562239 RepID=A0AA36N6X5_9DINO|nr:unnamed protein product [Effrenium voratum]